jgi:hypothetical protein
MIEGCGPFLAQLRKMRDHQQAIVDSETRANFSNAKTYSVLEVEKSDAELLSRVLRVAEAMLLGDGDGDAV